MGIEVQGLDRAKARLDDIEITIPEVSTAVLVAKAAEIFAVSEIEVPKRTGALAASGHVSPPIKEGNSVSVMITYGPLSYARIVHYNNRTVNHRTGRSYFVTDPLNDLSRDTAEEMSAAIETAIG